MAAANEIHVGSVGTVLRFTVKDNGAALDLSAATTKELVLLKPDRSTKRTVAAAFTGTGSDGKIQYTTASGDLDVAGLWQAQAHIVSSSGEWWTSSVDFQVFPNL